MNRKITAFLLVVLLAVTMVFAQGAQEANQTQVLKVAGLKGAYGDEYWKMLKAGFEASHPGVEVQLTVESNVEDIVTPQILAGAGPDVFYLAKNRPAGLTEMMLSSGAVADLSNLLDKNVYGEKVTLKDKLVSSLLTEVNLGNNGTQMLPLFFSSNGLFYNADLFYANNNNGVIDAKVDGKYEIPANWDEFLALGELLNTERKTNADAPYLFTYPTAGYLDTLIPATIISAAGKDVADKAFNYEPVWNQPEVRKVFEYLGALKPYLLPTTVANANGEGFQNNQQAVIDGTALFMCNGDWVKGEMAATTPEGFVWGTMPFLGFPGTERYGIVSVEPIWINNNTTKRSLAEEFILYVYSDEGLACFAKGSNDGFVPAVTYPEVAVANGMSAGAVDGYRDFYTGEAAFIGWSSFATASAEGVNWKATYCETMDSVMNGTKSVDQWIDQLMADSAKLKKAL